MSQSHETHHQEERVVYRTPNKIAFSLGVMAGITLTSLAAFIMTYSLLRADVTGTGTTTATNTAGTVAGANDTAPTTGDEAPIKADIAIKDTDHILGNPDAPITLVEYSDFECPYCTRVQPTLKQIMDDYGDKVRLIFRHFPLSFHPQAQKAGEASECAGEQGKFWEMHDKLFALNEVGTLSIDNYKKAAGELGLKQSQFDSCLDDGKFAQKITDDMTEGSQYGVNGTPATFVNGTLVSGAQPYASFKSVIDAAL